MAISNHKLFCDREYEFRIFLDNVKVENQKWEKERHTKKNFFKSQ